MSNENLPRWAQNKLEYNKRYEKENKIQVGIKLNKLTEPDVVYIFQQIPNKRQFLINALRQYGKEHNIVYNPLNDQGDMPE